MNHNAQPSGQPNQDSNTDPLAGLARWTASGAVDQAAVERARQRWLQQQIGESATLAGALADHAEAGRRVAVSTLSGRRTSGVVTAVGVDFVVIREANLGEVMIPLTRLAVVRSAPGEAEAVGDQTPRYEMVMAHALAQLAIERPSVLVAAGNEAVRGELQTVGSDVCTVLVNGPQRNSVHIAFVAIDHVVILAA